MQAGDETIYVLLRRAARELERLEAAALLRTSARLRPAYVPVLAALLEASPLTPGELCARCEAEPSTMTGLLRTLAARGLVTREKVVLDQRSVATALTVRGRAAARMAVGARDRAQAAVLRALPKEQAASLAPLLAGLGAVAQTLAAKAEERPARRRVKR